MHKKDKPEVWESTFSVRQEMWGMEPSRSALIANDYFVGQSVKNVLVPGIGYGLNAQLFQDNGMTLTGIEISKTAIAMAHKHYGELSEGWSMVFTVISKQAHTYGKGTYLSKDLYEVFNGIKMFFYDRDSINEEFGGAGLIEIMEVSEEYPCFRVTCVKKTR